MGREPRKNEASLGAKGDCIFRIRERKDRVKALLGSARESRRKCFCEDINPIISQAIERLGYPTQKPLVLLERILKASSNENDIVLDAFCGCGTALVAAQNLGRQWIGIDVSPTACRVMAKRLRDVCHLREDENYWRHGKGFVVRDLPWTEKQLREIPPFEFENWARHRPRRHPQQNPGRRHGY